MELHVRAFIENADGEFETEMIRPLSTFGECPQVGDVICGHSEAQIAYIVERRFFFHISAEIEGWALVVKRFENLEIAAKIERAWRADDQLWHEVHAREGDSEA